MHEMSITQSMFDIVMEQARQAGALKVKGINVCIGSMTGVVADSVRFYMELISKDTIVEGAELVVKDIGIKASCRQCGSEFEPGEDKWACPACGSLNMDITGGRELFVESIEVELKDGNKST